MFNECQDKIYINLNFIWTKMLTVYPPLLPLGALTFELTCSGLATGAQLDRRSQAAMGEMSVVLRPGKLQEGETGRGGREKGRDEARAAGAAESDQKSRSWTGEGEGIADSIASSRAFMSSPPA